MDVRIGSMKITMSPRDMLEDNFGFFYSAFYERQSSSELNRLCDNYGSDKGEITSVGHSYQWQSHSFADFYEARFGHCREYVRNVFECGLGTNDPTVPSNMGIGGKPGASLRVWRDFFPNARICGADIDKNILFQEQRISTYYVDQTSPEAISQLWNKVDVSEFDLMIDDGLHTFEAGICLFENSFHKLKTNGLYVIEDVWEYSLSKFYEYFKDKKFKVEFVILEFKKMTLSNNSLIVITR